MFYSSGEGSHYFSHLSLFSNLIEDDVFYNRFLRIFTKTMESIVQQSTTFVRKDFTNNAGEVGTFYRCLKFYFENSFLSIFNCEIQ